MSSRRSSFKSVVDMWNMRVGSTPDMIAMSHRLDDGWTDITWSQADARVRKIAAGLLAGGLSPEERCAILGETSVDWILADIGTMCAAGATTTVYPSSTAEECQYILSDCEAAVLFCDDDRQVAKILTQRHAVPALRQIVVFHGTPTEDGLVVTLAGLEKLGASWLSAHPEAVDEAAKAIEPGSLSTLIYTSGTTGTPKGVMLTHDAWVYTAEAIDKLGIISPADKQFLFLPLSHVFAKVMQVVFIRLGVPTAVDGSLDRLVENLGETNPTWMGAVPRVFEKAYNTIVSNARDAGAVHYGIFSWAIAVGKEVSRLRQDKREPGGLLKLQHALADRLVFSKVKDQFGGRIRFMISGGAPLPKEIAEFFHACDILLCEGYGLTESSAASTVNTPDDYVFGTVGKPLPGCEVQIADDGEILLRSRGVMRGYYHLPEATADCLVEGGWLRTGDIGTVLDSGHLKITDRKKEIIVTAGGKNVAPAQFQNMLKARSTYVSQVLMHGDKRNFCSALVTINEEAVTKWARDERLRFSDYPSLSALPEVRDLIQQAIDDVNRELPSYEQVKKFELLPEDLTVANGMLTPSMKMKRRVIETRYKERLDRFYTGSVARM